MLNSISLLSCQILKLHIFLFSVCETLEPTLSGCNTHVCPQNKTNILHPYKRVFHVNVINTNFLTVSRNAKHTQQKCFKDRKKKFDYF